MTLDLHRLQQLIAVAEEGSVTGAAARLHLSQQALSASLRALERDVGVELLDRSGSGGVRLLPAGQALVGDGRALLGAARAARDRARRIGRGEPEVLRLGHTPAVTGEEVGALLRAAQGRHPDLGAEPRQCYPPELVEGLLGGGLDVGLCRAVRPVRGLAGTTLVRQRLGVAVAVDHPLAGRESVALSELDGRALLVWGRPGSSGYTDLLIGLCREAGAEPRVRRTAMQGVPPAASVVGTGDAALVTAPPGPAGGGGARVVPVDPPAEVPLVALWPEHANSPVREAFLEAAGADADAAAGADSGGSTGPGTSAANPTDPAEPIGRTGSAAPDALAGREPDGGT